MNCYLLLLLFALHRQQCTQQCVLHDCILFLALTLSYRKWYFQGNLIEVYIENYLPKTENFVTQMNSGMSS